jgi:hypothetical protein
MKEIARGDNFLLTWHDDERTILLFEVLGAWTWDEAYKGIGKINETIAAVDRDVYTIFSFANHAVTFPKGSALPHIRYLLSQEYENERLVIFIGSHSFIQTFLAIVGKIYGLRQVVAKYHFVPSLNAALEVIEHDKRVRLQETRT